MARIAFFSIYAFGHTNPTLAVVGELTRRGHRVRYYSFPHFRKRSRRRAGSASCATPIFRLLPLMWTAR